MSKIYAEFLEDNDLWPKIDRLLKFSQQGVHVLSNRKEMRFFSELTYSLPECFSEVLSFLDLYSDCFQIIETLGNIRICECEAIFPVISIKSEENYNHYSIDYGNKQLIMINESKISECPIPYCQHIWVSIIMDIRKSFELFDDRALLESALNGGYILNSLIVELEGLGLQIEFNSEYNSQQLLRKLGLNVRRSLELSTLFIRESE